MEGGLGYPAILLLGEAHILQFKMSYGIKMENLFSCHFLFVAFDRFASLGGVLFVCLHFNKCDLI